MWKQLILKVEGEQNDGNPNLKVGDLKLTIPWYKNKI